MREEYTKVYVDSKGNQHLTKNQCIRSDVFFALHDNGIHGNTARSMSNSLSMDEIKGLAKQLNEALQ